MNANGRSGQSLQAESAPSWLSAASYRDVPDYSIYTVVMLGEMRRSDETDKALRKPPNCLIGKYYSLMRARFDGVIQNSLSSD